MSRLPGTETWPDTEVRHRIAFLEALSANTPKLVAEMARASGYQSPERFAERPNDAVYTLVEAAELAFAIDDVGLGVVLCRKVAELLGPDTRTLTPMQTILAATVGAIAGVVDVVLHPNAVIVLRDKQVAAAFGLSSPSSRYNLALFQRAAYGVIASGRYEPTLVGGGEGEPHAAAWRSFATTFEGRMFSADQVAISFDKTILARGAAVLERTYDDQIAAQKSDKMNWQRFIARGGLIDWRLLALRTGVDSRYVELLLPEPNSPGGAFLASTARSIVHWRRDRRV